MHAAIVEMASNTKAGATLQCGLLALASARACNSAVISCAVAPVITPFKPASPFRTASNWASDMRFSSSMRRRTGLMCDTSGASMSVGSGINAYRLKAGVLAHKSNIAPAIADYKSVCYSLLVSKEMEFDSSKSKRPTAPDSHAVFLRPDLRFMAGRVAIRKDAHLACSRLSTSRPPFWLRVVALRKGFLSLSKERSMSQSALAFVPTLTVIDGTPTTTSVDIAKHFGKEHAKILRSIELLVESNRAIFGGVNFNDRNFAAVEYLDAKGERRPAYRLTRDGFTLLAMGFTGQRALSFKLAYIDAFNRMEAQLHGKTPTLLNRRWLVSYDHTGKEQVTAIPDDAFVMSIPEILKALNDPGVLIETEVLFEFCIKAMQRLQSRAAFLKQKSLKTSSAKESSHV